MDKHERREHDEAVQQQKEIELKQQADELLDEAGFSELKNRGILKQPKSVAGGVGKHPEWIKNYKRKPKDV